MATQNLGFQNWPLRFAKFGKGCLLFFSKGKEQLPKKNQKTPKPYRGSLSSPKGTPKGKKRGLLREDIPPPYSALEEPKTTKSASEEEKTNPVYIIYLIGIDRKGAFGQKKTLERCFIRNTTILYTPWRVFLPFSGNFADDVNVTVTREVHA